MVHFGGRRSPPTCHLRSTPQVVTTALMLPALPRLPPSQLAKLPLSARPRTSWVAPLAPLLEVPFCRVLAHGLAALHRLNATSRRPTRLLLRLPRLELTAAARESARELGLAGPCPPPSRPAFSNPPLHASLQTCCLHSDACTPVPRDGVARAPTFCVPSPRRLLAGADAADGGADGGADGPTAGRLLGTTGDATSAAAAAVPEDLEEEGLPTSVAVRGPRSGTARKWLPYAEACDFVHRLGLENSKQWVEWSKSGQRPSNIPARPSKVYRGKGWVNIADWLGPSNTNVSNHNRQWLPYAEARDFVHRLGLESRKQWKEWRKSGQRPSNIPTVPGKIYQGKGWVNIADWLGPSNTNVSTHNRQWLPYAEARDFVHRLGLQNGKQWKEWRKSRRRPSSIPAHPSKVYRGKGYVNLADWLGTSREATPAVAVAAAVAAVEAGERPRTPGKHPPARGRRGVFRRRASWPEYWDGEHGIVLCVAYRTSMLFRIIQPPLRSSIASIFP